MYGWRILLPSPSRLSGVFSSKNLVASPSEELFGLRCRSTNGVGSISSSLSGALENARPASKGGAVPVNCAAEATVRVVSSGLLIWEEETGRRCESRLWRLDADRIAGGTRLVSCFSCLDRRALGLRIPNVDFSFVRLRSEPLEGVDSSSLCSGIEDTREGIPTPFETPQNSSGRLSIRSAVATHLWVRLLGIFSLRSAACHAARVRCLMRRQAS